MADASLGQLMDMGIPRGRARAALKRSKGDAMAAAERVFAGEFDDIPSEDEGEDEVMAVQTGLQASALSLVTPLSDGVSDDMGDEAMVTSDQEYMGSDSDVGYGDHEDEIDLDDFEAEPRLQDPYAGVFFSKDRKEQIVEGVPEITYADVRNPPSLRRDVQDKTKRVRILSLQEWMSGCPEGGEQSFLFSLYNSLSEGTFKCSNHCGHVYQRKPEHFFPLFDDFSTYAAHLADLIQPQCPKCKGVTCFACGERVVASKKSYKTKALDGEIASLFHCPNIQGAILGVGVHMIEQAFGNTHTLNTDDSSTPSSVSNPSKKRKTSPSSKSTMKIISKLMNAAQAAHDSSQSPLDHSSDSSDDGKGASRGIGYSGAINEDRSGQIAVQQAREAKDKKTATLLSEIRSYLPAVHRGLTSDLMVHPTVLANIRRRSGFVNDLLRSDSLMEMSNRSVLYDALFDWLEIVSSHEALASMLGMPQMRPIKTEPGPQPDSYNVTYAGSESPRELLERVVIEATAALKAFKAVEAPVAEMAVDPTTTAAQHAANTVSAGVDTDDQNNELKKFCERILSSRKTIDRLLVATKGDEFVERMYETLPRLHRGSEDILKDVDEANIVKIYEEWASRVRFQYCDMINPADESKQAYLHAYDTNIRKLVGQDLPKRSLAIAKELAILTTNLPAAWDSTVFLRVDESRVDCIKALIIGPKDTPYENGCFIFDIFLPGEYNQRPPYVKSMTTNGGKYRYNPNLYNDGKVCLSLLGTWSGPGWESGKSTLLQVLISIQSLILCEEPYLNEPGWAEQAGTPQSKAYSANVRRMVLFDAMANNLREPPYPFEDVIKTHFKLKANSIRAQLDRWEALDDRKSTVGDSLLAPPPNADGVGSSKSAFGRATAELRSLLDEVAGPAPPVPGSPVTRRSHTRHVKKTAKV